jgi:hypothetical protein
MARSKPCSTFCQSAGSGQDGDDCDKACAGPGEGGGQAGEEDSAGGKTTFSPRCPLLTSLSRSPTEIAISRGAASDAAESGTSGGQGLAEFVTGKELVCTPVSINLGELVDDLGEKLVCLANFESQNHKFLISVNFWYRPFSRPSGCSTPPNPR